MGTDFYLNKEKKQDWSVVRVQGALDIATAHPFREALASAVEMVEEQHLQGVMVDLLQTTFLDSTNLGLLLGSFKRLKEKELKFALLVDNPKIIQLLTITGVSEVLKTALSEAEIFSPELS